MQADMEAKEVIKLSQSAQETVIAMAGGNPGALRVCMELLQKEHGFMSLLFMDVEKIRGHRIWIGYNDICKQDIDVFAEKTLTRDQAFLKELKDSPSWNEHMLGSIRPF